MRYRLRRLKKQITQILVLVSVCQCVSVSVCSAQPISSTELINNAKVYDGKTVTFEGEAIGDVMVRGQGAWVNLNDGVNAIGIWMDKNLSKAITYTGSYRTKGDRLEVTGVFHRACPEHGGDLDIHAQTLRRISVGKELQEKFNLAKGNQAVIFLGVLIIIWILSRLKRKSA